LLLDVFGHELERDEAWLNRQGIPK
jgi:hypothetical protein